MLTRIVQMEFEPDKLEAFLAHFETVKWQVAQFKGCRGIQLMQDIHQPCIVLTYSIWDSEQDLDNYRHSALFTSIWPQIKPWFAQKAQAWSLNTTFNGIISEK